MPGEKRPEKTLDQPKSSSGIIFYWGIKHDFKQLGLYNIFFAENYEEEFDTIFSKEDLPRSHHLRKHHQQTRPPTLLRVVRTGSLTINVPNNQGQD